MNEKAANEFMVTLQNAGLPVIAIANDKPRYDRALDEAEEAIAQTIQNTYDTGKFNYLDAREYPSVETQLDMIYWDGVNATTIWSDTIMAIKNANPKPS